METNQVKGKIYSKSSHFFGETYNNPFVACVLYILTYKMTELKVAVQTLKNDRHEIVILTTDTVDGVKGKIASELSSLQIAADEMRLIHSGRKLDDGEQTIEDAKIADGDLFVIMKVRKKKKKNKKAEVDYIPRLYFFLKI